ncbi:hypothetical protein BDZ88DRAFT_453731 [Geranomyces variabilis]|nr:hypothetical protein BDZ88DRAFT_453731 [Geranomyces variabilis]
MSVANHPPSPTSTRSSSGSPPTSAAPPPSRKRQRPSSASSSSSSGTTTTTTPTSSSSSSSSAKRYKCTTCPLMFRRAEHLTRHVMTHSGDRPFTCSECGRGFSRCDALRRHARIHSAEAVNQKIVTTASSNSGNNNNNNSTGNTAVSTDYTFVLEQPMAAAIPTPVVEVPPPLAQLTPQPSVTISFSRGVCPTTLHALATSTVSLLVNADRAIYQCPIRGCATHLAATHLAAHLEENNNHKRGLFSQKHVGCEPVAERDLRVWVDHVVAVHGVKKEDGAECRECGGRGHGREEYYHAAAAAASLATAAESDTASTPVRARHHTHGGSSSSFPGVVVTLRDVLAGAVAIAMAALRGGGGMRGNAKTYAHHRFDEEHESNDHEDSDIDSVRADAGGGLFSDREMSVESSTAGDAHNSPTFRPREDPLAMLAMCAADELARVNNKGSNTYHHFHQYPVMMTATVTTTRLRIQDLLN